MSTLTCGFDVYKHICPIELLLAPPSSSVHKFGVDLRTHIHQSSQVTLMFASIFQGVFFTWKKAMRFEEVF